MVVIKNKKGYSTGIFGFFFILVIFASLFFFLTFGMHYILYDYGISQAEDITDTLLTNTTSIQNLGQSYLNLTGFYDLLFLVLLVSLFIESTIAAVKTAESGFLSFFGFITIGNLFLIFILSYAVKVQGWIINDLVYNVILVNITTPVLTAFFNYSLYIGVIWYLWLIAVNQINSDGIKQKFQNLFPNKQEKTEDFQDEAFGGFKE